MCTVVFFPGQNQQQFASLRDESPLRARALKPRLLSGKGHYYLAPTDAAAGGTWLGLTQHGDVLILLNGGFVAHQNKSVYQKSRGLIVKELLEGGNPIWQWQDLMLANIEPFTLVVFSKGQLVELVWTGDFKHEQRLNPRQAHIWSSSTLYTSEAKQQRCRLFNNWLQTGQEVTQHSLLAFFESVKDTHNGFVMNRAEQVKTLSYTYVEVAVNDLATMHYKDFRSAETHTEYMRINSGNEAINH